MRLMNEELFCFFLFFFIHFVVILISVIPKQRLLPTVENIELNSLIPQWAIAVIVIGVGSLLFVVIFGVAVVSSD